MHPYYPAYQSPPIEALGAPGPVYVILIIGMVLFMTSNAMPALTPSPDKIGNVAPFILQWGFVLVLFALMAQMTGVLPGVPRLHITYVHLTVAFLFFFIIWNQVVADLPPEPAPASSSSSSKREEKKEEKKEKKEEKEPEPTPWDDLRAHPSAFLTTRLNRMLPWPFPMGKAERKGNELWWESGMPAHVGHFNRPSVPESNNDQGREKTDKDKEKKQDKPSDKEKEKGKAKPQAKESARPDPEKEKQRAAEKEKERAKLLEKEVTEKKKKAEDEAKKKKEAEVIKVRAAEKAKRKAAEDKEHQKLWRTKTLAMIIGISLLNKTLGFLLLLLFSIQLVSQELNPPLTMVQPQTSSTLAATSGGSSSSARPVTASSSSAGKPSDPDAEKLAKMKALKEKEKEKAKATAAAAAAGSTTSSSSSRPSASSEHSSRSSSRLGSSSSSSSKEKPVTSAAIREAAGSTTQTTSADSAIGVPYSVGFGMHYIHSAPLGKLDLASSSIPSEGMAHPLMTTTWKGYAN